MDNSDLALNYQEIIYDIHFHCTSNGPKKCNYCGNRDDKCICKSKIKLKDAIYTIKEESRRELSNIFHRKNTFILLNLLEYFQQKQIEEVSI